MVGVFHLTSPSAAEAVVERRWRLLVVDGPDAGLSAWLERDPALIGAAPAAELRLTDDTVSRFHAELDLGPAACVLRDLGSKNGIRSAGRRIERIELAPGARVQVGETRLELGADDRPGAGSAARALGLPELGPALSAALRRRAGPLELEALRRGDRSAPPELRRALLADLLSAARGDLDRVAERVGQTPRRLLRELTRLGVQLEE